jgi:two-component system OmpR family response regulator
MTARSPASLRLDCERLACSYLLDIAYSAEEGLELFNQHGYDLVMSDYNLRGMNGLSLLITIKRAKPDLPTVLFTAYDTPKLQRDAQSAGVNGYIAKPFLIEDFVSLARHLLPAIENEIGASPS